MECNKSWSATIQPVGRLTVAWLVSLCKSGKGKSAKPESSSVLLLLDSTMMVATDAADRTPSKVASISSAVDPVYIVLL